jgi:replication fork protection complex subunit Tof1/Swi1
VTLNPKKARMPEAQTNDASVPEPAPSQSYVLHRQQAIVSETGAIFDMVKKQRARRGKKTDELTREDNLSLEARQILQDLAQRFTQSCFNSAFLITNSFNAVLIHFIAFLSSLLKDIKSERVKVSEKDNLRLLYVAKWFLEFFLQTQAKDRTGTEDDSASWDFGLVAEVTERSWIVWVLRRMREALDSKVCSS